MAADEFVIAVFLSIFGVASLPRKSVRMRYAALGTRSRVLFWWFGGGSLILAISLWLDLALSVGDQKRISLAPVIVAGAGLWILVLAVGAIPDIWRQRSRPRM